ncbi:25S rRNA (adenine645-N1)-methyltransferase [Coemansia biformis]|uniref:Ribosomal RNA-processing protein 8 n=1 Tax=Coemansia biformis TaxID=1286918 RepID=A0A9W8CZT0_9FUNG|nr:25S rRNA (adenine645-N1)-methyltransferase [Coemansia biformis]
MDHRPDSRSSTARTGTGATRAAAGAGAGPRVAKKESTSQRAHRLKRVRELLATRNASPKPREQVQQRSPQKPEHDKQRQQRQQQPQPQQGSAGLSALQMRMQQKLKGARFRWINESMYTTTGEETFKMVQNDPSIFEEYHEGFAAQVRKWPANPLDLFIRQLEGRQRLVVADMGCGEARLAAAIGEQHTVHSFDLVGYNKRITPCNIANVPLSSGTADMAIFCLALMGTDFIAFIREANRILRMGGELKLAEVVSRISDMDAFVAALEEQGFKLGHKDTANKMFVVLNFTKIGPHPKNASAQPGLLKPCIYKRR